VNLSRGFFAQCTDGAAITWRMNNARNHNALVVIVLRTFRLHWQQQ